MYEDINKIVWENMSKPDLSTEDREWIRLNIPFNSNEIDIVNGSVNGGRKLLGNSQQNLTKIKAISGLNNASWKTPAKDLAFYLEIIFGSWESKPEHWLYIAQHYSPKTIRSVRAQMVKAFKRGDATIRNPGAFFTFIIKHKKKRKIFRKEKDEKS